MARTRRARRPSRTRQSKSRRYANNNAAGLGAAEKIGLGIGGLTAAAAAGVAGHIYGIDLSAKYMFNDNAINGSVEIDTTQPSALGELKFGRYSAAAIDTQNARSAPYSKATQERYSLQVRDPMTAARDVSGRPLTDDDPFNVAFLDLDDSRENMFGLERTRSDLNYILGQLDLRNRNVTGEELRAVLATWIAAGRSETDMQDRLHYVVTEVIPKRIDAGQTVFGEVGHESPYANIPFIGRYFQSESHDGHDHVDGDGDGDHHTSHNKNRRIGSELERLSYALYAKISGEAVEDISNSRNFMINKAAPFSLNLKESNLRIVFGASVADYRRYRESLGLTGFDDRDAWVFAHAGIEKSYDEREARAYNGGELPHVFEDFGGRELKETQLRELKETQFADLRLLRQVDTTNIEMQKAVDYFNAKYGREPEYNTNGRRNSDFLDDTIGGRAYTILSTAGSWIIAEGRRQNNVSVVSAGQLVHDRDAYRQLGPHLEKLRALKDSYISIQAAMSGTLDLGSFGKDSLGLGPNWGSDDMLAAWTRAAQISDIDLLKWEASLMAIIGGKVDPFDAQGRIARFGNGMGRIDEIAPYSEGAKNSLAQRKAALAGNLKAGAIALATQACSDPVLKKHPDFVRFITFRVLDGVKSLDESLGASVQADVEKIFASDKAKCITGLSLG